MDDVADAFEGAGVFGDWLEHGKDIQLSSAFDCSAQNWACSKRVAESRK